MEFVHSRNFVQATFKHLTTAHPPSTIGHRPSTMAFHSSLPTEIVIKIYSFLSSIDDALHLSQTCRKAHTITQNRKVYLDIMGSIMLSSSTHRFDIQLCRLLELQKGIAKDVLTNQSYVDIARNVSVASCSSPNVYESRLYSGIMDPADKITDEQVDTILARHQGLRSLQALYLLMPRQPLLKCCLQGNEFLCNLDAVQKRDLSDSDTDVSSNPSGINFVRDLDSAQRGRFHAAVTQYWVLNLVRWIQSHFDYRYPQMGIELRRELIGRLDSQSPCPLLDAIDLLEVYTFLYKQLLPRHARALADNSNLVNLTYTSHIPGDYTESSGDTMSDLSGTAGTSTPDYACSFKAFYLGACSALNPSDIIELAVRDTISRYPPYPLIAPPSSSFALWAPKADFLDLLNFDRTRHASFASPFSSSGLCTYCDPHLNFLRDRVIRCAKSALHDMRGKHLNKEMWSRWDNEVKDCVWWWATTEEKAKMKIQRWRESR